MTDTRVGGGLCNCLIRNICVSLLAEAMDLRVHYAYWSESDKLGIPLFSGNNIYPPDKNIIINDDNWMDTFTKIRTLSLGNLVFDEKQMFFQNKSISHFLYTHYFRNDGIKNNIIERNIFKSRYKTNNDIFIHVRLGDITDKHSLPLSYYVQAIQQKSEYGAIFIGSDSPDHFICQQLITIFERSSLFLQDEVSTIQFASTCKTVILSHGTFSAMIGYLAYDSDVYYPQYLKTPWHGDILSIDGWNCIVWNEQEPPEIKQEPPEIKQNKFDIVIPVGPNDMDIIYKQLPFTLQNIIGYRNIYIITNITHFTYNLDSYPNVFIVDERIFPFTIQDICVKIHKERAGWYFQQLIKLYASFVISHMLPTYLVIDVDTFFLYPTTFIKHSNTYLFNVGTEYNKAYFDHMYKLSPTLKKVFPENSGICHHMIFQKERVLSMMQLCMQSSEQKKNDLDFWNFWKLFLECIDPSENSGASEYEMYFNYMLLYYPTEIEIRKLEWTNSSNFNEIQQNSNKYDYVSVHWYSRK